MSNKTALKNYLKSEEIKSNKPVANQVNEKKITPDKLGEKKQKKLPGKSSALVAASLGRSAVDHVKASSRGDMSGSSGLANTGPNTSYSNDD